MRTKRTTSRLLSVLLCLVMVLGLLPTAAFAVGTGDGTKGNPVVVTTYADLKAEMGRSGSGNTHYVKLGGNINSGDLRQNGTIDVTGLVELDLNGHTLTLNTTSLTVNYFIRVYGNLTISDSSEPSTGTIKMEHDNNYAGFKGIFVDNKLTVNSGTIKSNSETYKNHSSLIYGNNNGTVVINGGTFSNNGFRNGNLLTCSHSLWANYNSNLVINGGTFNGVVGIYAKKPDSGSARKVINGGTFNHSVAFFKNDKDAQSLDVAIKGGTFKKDEDPDSYFANLGVDGFELDHQRYTNLPDAPWRNESSVAYASMFPSDTTILCEGDNDHWQAEKRTSRVLFGSDDTYTLLSGLLGKEYQITVGTLQPGRCGSYHDTITVFSGGVSDAKLTPYGGTAISSLGKATITPGTTTFTITATAADGLKTLVKDGRAEYTLTALVFKNDKLLSRGTDKDFAVAHEENGADSDGNPYIQIQLKNDTPAAGDVYSIAAYVKPVAKDTENQLCDSAIGSWTLTTEAAPPEPVAHNITITNGHGTASTSTAKVGDTVTVTANDRTADNLMFTQWYAYTSGVTFDDATQQATTFTMPDYAVSVSPGFQSVGFTKQPAKNIGFVKDSGGDASFAFSWDISKWELVDTTTKKVEGSGGTVTAGTLTKATIPANTTTGTKTYQIVVTTPNGEKFKSDEFTVLWYDYVPAPLVEFDIPDGTKFVKELTAGLSYLSTLADGTPSPYELKYTTNGVDPKDADESDIKGLSYVELTDTTTIKARTYERNETTGVVTWGELCEATYTKVSKLDDPTVIPESQSYSGSLPITMIAPDVYGATIYYDVEYGDGTSRTENKYDPATGFTIPRDFGGTTKITPKSIVWSDGSGPLAMSDGATTYTYTRLYWADIANVTVSGKVNQAITGTDVTIKLDGEKIKGVAAGNDVSDWFTNRPAGLTATVKNVAPLGNEMTVTISGTPTAASAETITVKIPAANLTYNTAADLNVLSNPKAYYSIGADDTHEHDFTGQPWNILDDDFHYQLCKSNDASNLQPHSFGNWTPDASDANKHYRVCSDCGHKVSASHDESSRITDKTPNIGVAGSWHTECLDCGKKMDSGTLDALTKIDVEKLTVAKPVKDVACAAATTTDTTYDVAYTEWLDQNGDPLAAGESFKAGTVYSVKITLEGKDNNVFSANSSYNTIEGKTATVSPALTGDAYAYSVVLTYTFDATAGDYVPVAPAITTATLPDGKVGEAYSALLDATGDKPITWSVDSGNLPDGLMLNSANGAISGTPSKAGSFTFTVKASNTASSATQAFTVVIADADASKYHTVTLSGAGIGATGAGSHAANTPVNIYAGTKSGYTFAGWTTTSTDVTILSASSKNASFFMPNHDVEVQANWIYNGGGSGGGYAYYTIKATAGVNGSISPSGNVSVREGRDQTFTITPDKGYAVAKVLVDSKNVGAVRSYTFENVKKAHTIEVVFMKSSGNPQTGVFVDVPEGSYYEEAVNWAVEQGITHGTDATHFSPDGICTRAQAVTFLWRAAGSPAPKSSTMPFTDVKSGVYYYDAVLWAVENGITKGTTDTTFSPSMNCSRAQIVTFLWRSEQSPAAGTVNPFTDVKADAYYADAVLWAVKEDVTKGTTATTFSPDANCTRAQIVTFIYRALAE